jgi:hypothetical protein
MVVTMEEKLFIGKNVKSMVDPGTIYYTNLLGEISNEGFRISSSSFVQSKRLESNELLHKSLLIGNNAFYTLIGDNVFLFYMKPEFNSVLSKRMESNSRVCRSVFNLNEVSPDGFNLKDDFEKSGIVKFNISDLESSNLLSQYVHNKKVVFFEVNNEDLVKGKDFVSNHYNSKIVNMINAFHGDAIYGSNGIASKLLEYGKNTSPAYFTKSNWVKQVLKKNKKHGDTVWIHPVIGSLGLSSRIELTEPYHINKPYLCAYGIKQ